MEIHFRSKMRPTCERAKWKSSDCSCRKRSENMTSVTFTRKLCTLEQNMLVNVEFSMKASAAEKTLRKLKISKTFAVTIFTISWFNFAPATTAKHECAQDTQLHSNSTHRRSFSFNFLFRKFLRKVSPLLPLHIGPVGVCGRGVRSPKPHRRRCRSNGCQFNFLLTNGTRTQTTNGSVNGAKQWPVLWKVESCFNYAQCVVCSILRKVDTTSVILRI